MKRRDALTLLTLAATTAAAAVMLRPTSTGYDAVGAAAGRDAPMAGNPSGDLAVVAFLDYGCPECKAAAPSLHRFVADDAGVRLVYRDWPIVGPGSVEAARLALAARYQGRYEAAHDALMAMRGRLGPAERLHAVLANAGLDIDRLTADAAGRADEIEGQLARNAGLAAEMRLRGVPQYFVGGRRIARGFDVETFRSFAVMARA